MQACMWAAFHTGNSMAPSSVFHRGVLHIAFNDTQLLAKGSAGLQVEGALDVHGRQLGDQVLQHVG
jgi:hypothetical protein